MVDMLIMRGARINVMNRGDDTPLHLAASHGHRDIVQKVPASRGQQHPAPSPPPSGHPPGPCAAPWQTAEQDPAQPSILSTQDSLPLSPTRFLAISILHPHCGASVHLHLPCRSPASSLGPLPTADRASTGARCWGWGTCSRFTGIVLLPPADPVQSRHQCCERAWEHASALRLLLGP